MLIYCPLNRFFKLKDNIMTDIDLLLNHFDTNLLAYKIAENSKINRIRHNLTQKELAESSGVSLSSLKRFEQKHQISLENLLKIAVTLDAVESFEKLFSDIKKNTLDEYLNEKKIKNRKRVRKK